MGTAYGQGADPPVITGQPQSQYISAGSTATFTVTAEGSSPLFYQWRKDGTNLVDGVNITAATNSTLPLTNVQVRDGCSYSVVVANLVGTAVSDPTLLIVEVPQVPPGDDFTDLVAIARHANDFSLNLEPATLNGQRSALNPRSLSLSPWLRMKTEAAT